MNDGIIHERKYGDILRKLSEQGKDGENYLSSTFSESSPEEYAKTLLSNAVSVVIPERVEGKVKFIEAAKEIGAEYLIDLTISAFNNYITATYSLECNSDFHCLKKIISQADEISFQSDGDKVLLSLNYYTHATYLSGRKVSPLDD